MIVSPLGWLVAAPADGCHGFCTPSLVTVEVVVVVMTGKLLLLYFLWWEASDWSPNFIHLSSNHSRQPPGFISCNDEVVHCIVWYSVLIDSNSPNRLALLSGICGFQSSGYEELHLLEYNSI
jgi:hypothetical protein